MSVKMVKKLVCLTALLSGSSAVKISQSSLELAGKNLENQQMLTEVIKTWRYFDGNDEGMDLA